MIDSQDLVSFGRFELSKNSKLPLFSFGSSKLLSVFCQFHSFMPIVGQVAHPASLTLWPIFWLGIAGPHPEAHVHF